MRHNEFPLTSISSLHDCEVCILIAHGYDNGAMLEFSDGAYNPADVANQFDPGFEGIVDLSSCYSSALMSIMKARCPHCNVIGVSSKTSLILRLVTYLQVFRVMLRQPKLNYIEAMESSLESLQRIVDEQGPELIGNHSKRKIVYLGGEEYSSVYAPGSVKKGDTFLVQVFIHKEQEKAAVEEEAKALDSETEFRKTKALDISPKEGDYIEIDLSVVNDSPDFSIDEKRQSFRWRNEYTSVEFPVTIDKSCEASSFIGKLRVFINKEPATMCMFKVIVVEAGANISYTSDVSYHSYDKNGERLSAKRLLVNTLQNSIKELEGTSGHTNKTVELCRQCISIINQTSDFCNPIKKVFISSTSDMGPWRQIAKQQVESCNMYPEMYENWPQGSNYPCDECCKKVLSSDIFLCILGPKYGFVEPSFGMSMTEIEYRVAFQSGKPILVYISKDYLNQMKSQLEDSEKTEKQRAFINEVSLARMVDFFEDELDLSLMTRSELIMVKKDMEYDNSAKN